MRLSDSSAHRTAAILNSGWDIAKITDMDTVELWWWFFFLFYLFLWYFLFPFHNLKGAKRATARIIGNEEMPWFIRTVWIARLIKPYYPACLIATASVPHPHPLLTAGRDVYPGNHWQQVERSTTLMAGSFPRWNACGFIPFSGLDFSVEELLLSPWKTSLFQISRDEGRTKSISVFTVEVSFFLCGRMSPGRCRCTRTTRVWVIFVNLTVRERI